MSPLFIAVVACAGIALFAGQRWVDKHKPPKRDPLVALEPPPLSSEEGREFVESVLAASDAASALWPPADVQEAQARLQQRYGVVPGREYLVSRYPPAKAQGAITEALDSRARLVDGLRKLETIAVRPEVCHVCGRPTAARIPFGLARLRRVEHEFGAALASLALSAVLGPFIGFGVVYGPGKQVSGNLLRLQLQMCSECDRDRKGRFGLGKVREQHYAHHPWWDAAHQAGFTTFVSEAELEKWHQGASPSPPGPSGIGSGSR